MVSAHLRTDAASAERVGQGEVGGGPVHMVADRLGLKKPWLVLSKPILALAV